MWVLIFRQSEFLEDYVAKELIQIVKTKYQSKKSNTNIEVIYIYINIINYNLFM